MKMKKSEENPYFEAFRGVNIVSSRKLHEFILM